NSDTHGLGELELLPIRGFISTEAFHAIAQYTNPRFLDELFYLVQTRVGGVAGKVHATKFDAAQTKLFYAVERADRVELAETVALATHLPGRTGLCKRGAGERGQRRYGCQLSNKLTTGG